MVNKKIVCLGGGIGTANLIRGLKDYYTDISVVVSMADDGGSAGRLRRFFSVPPPGDLVRSIKAMSNADPIMQDLLTFRFSGDRYGSDSTLSGHKFGNLMLVALSSMMGDFAKAVYEMQKIFKVSGKIFPSTLDGVSIWAETSKGDKVYREENIDLGRFSGKIEKLHLAPRNPRAPRDVIKAILNAAVIVAGPGDLYTTILPVLLVPDILDAVNKSSAKKVFVVNVANKKFETPNYKINDFINAIINHCGSEVFDCFIINTNMNPQMPAKLSNRYKYVKFDSKNGIKPNNLMTIKKDLIDENFPLYHDPKKLAKTIVENI